MKASLRPVRSAVLMLCGSGLLGYSIGAHAVALPPWVGSANYLAAPGALGDEELIGPFDSYDFANGVSLVVPTLVQNPGQVTPGDTYTGYYQSYVALHQLSGVPVLPTVLNTAGAAGSGSGYELTITVQYQSVVTVSPGGGNFFFTLTGGNASLQFDTTPDYSFTADSGFSDGATILSGTVVGGTGSFSLLPGVGFSSIDLVVGPLGYDQNVYQPANIGGGSGIFTLLINSSGTGPSAGVGSVMGVPVAQGLLEEADGNLRLRVVPLPAAVWLLGLGFAGYLGISRFNRRNEGVTPA